MVQIIFDPSLVDYDSFFVKFENQLGGAHFMGTRFQRGYGGFDSVRMQVGNGFGGTLGSLLRMLLPVAKKAGSSLAKEGFNVGSKILGEMAEGRKPDISTEIKRGVSNLVKKSKQNGGRRKTIRVLNKFNDRLVPANIVSKRKRDIFS